MSQKSEVKSKIIIDETGIIDGSGANGIIKGNNSTFDADIGDWLEYTDAVQALPEDGAGAAAADLIVERTTFASEILDGNGSLKITKANLANAQGQGASLTIPVPKANRAQPHKLSFDFDSAVDFVPANPADPIGTPGDVGVYLYDVTNSKLLTPNQPYITSGKGRYESLVQLPSDCEEARVILHVQSTSTDLWVLFADNFKLDIASNEYIDGVIIDTATVTGFTSRSTNNVLFATTQRAPDKGIIEIDTASSYTKFVAKTKCTVTATFSAQYTTTAATAPTINLNDSTDTQKVSTICTFVNANSAGNSGSITAEMEVGDYIYVASGVNLSNNLNCHFSIQATTNTSGYNVAASIGLNAQAVMLAYKTSGSSTAGTTITSWTAKDKDTVGGFDLATGQYTVKSPGDYQVNFQMCTSTNGSQLAQIYLNGVEKIRGSNSAATGYDSISNILTDLKYGDVIEARSNGTVTFLGGQLTKLGIHKIGSEQQPYAPRVAYLKDVKTAGTQGGSITSGSFVTRVLNTFEGDTSFISSAGGTTGTDGTSTAFTLQPGTYIIEGHSPYFYCGNIETKLRNTTDASDAIAGTSTYSGTTASDGASAESTILGKISINSVKTFELQCRVSVTRTVNGLGPGVNLGVDHVYSELKITKVL